jgi:hypothetical protein
VSGNTIFAGTTVGDPRTDGGGVFLSTHNGKSWTEVDSGLTSTRVNALAVSGSTIFAGTTVGDPRTDGGGVFLSTNDGTSWTEIDSGLPNVTVWSLAVSGSNLFAGLNGGGVWRRPISDITGTINHKPQGGMADFTLRSPSHTSQNTTIEFSLPHSDQVTVEIYNLSGRKITTLVNRNFGPGAYIITWDSRNSAAGCYVVKMKAGSNTCVKKIPFFR